MGKTVALTQAEKDRIASLLRSGESVNKTARTVGRSVGAVSNVAKSEGIDTNVQATKKAVEASKNYDKANRLQLLNKLFDKGAELLERDDLTARDYKDLSTGIAIGIDKRRLEDGEASKVSEQRVSGSGLDLDAEFKKLDKELSVEAKDTITT